MPVAGQRKRSPTPPRRNSPTRTASKKKNTDDEVKYHVDVVSSSWRPHASVPTYKVAPRGKRGYFASLSEAIQYAEPFSRIEVMTGNYFENVLVTKPIEIVASPDCEETPCFTSRAVTFTVHCECYIDGLQISTSDRSGEGVGMRISVMPETTGTARPSGGAAGGSSVNRDDAETSMPKIIRCTIDSMDVCGKTICIIEDNKIVRSHRTGIQVLDESGGIFKGNAVEEHDGVGLVVSSTGHCEFLHNKFSKSLSCQVVVHGRKSDRDVKAGQSTRVVAPVFRYNRFCDDAPIRDGKGVDGAGGGSGGVGGGGAGGKKGGNNINAAQLPLRTTDDLVCLIPAHEKNRHVDMEEWQSAENDDVLDRRCAVEVYNGAEPLFETNMFMQSVGMGLRVHTTGKGIYRYNRFAQNRTFAATFEGEDTTPLFLDNNVQDNGLGGVRVRDNCTPRIEGNNFVENRGPQLIVMRGCAKMCVLYNLFITSGRVGAVLKSNAGGHFVGNTFRDTHIGIRIEDYSAPTFSSLLEGRKVTAADRKTTQSDRDETNRFQQCYIGVAATHHAHGMFDGVDFSNSRACAVMLLTDARTAFHKCKFLANERSVLVQRSGKGTFTACQFRDNHQSTVVIKERGNPTFHDCQFLRGQEDAVVVSDNGLGRFTRNFFSENEMSHFVIKSCGDPEIHENLMVSSGKAAVMVSEGGAGQITNNLICANYGDGLLVESFSAPTVRNNVIRGNHGAGISIAANGDGLIEKNEFLENRGANAVITGGKEAGGAAAGAGGKKAGGADDNSNNNHHSSATAARETSGDPLMSPTKSVTFDASAADNGAPAASSDPASPLTDASLKMFEKLDSSAVASVASAGVFAALGKLHSKGYVLLRRNWFLRSIGGGVLCEHFGKCILVENVFDQESSLKTSAVRIRLGGSVIAVANRFTNGSGLFVGESGHCIAMMNMFRNIDGAAIVLDTGSRPYIAWNTIEDCAVGVACTGGGVGACFENVMVRCRMAAVSCERFSYTAIMGNVVLYGGAGVVARDKAKNKVSGNFFYGMNNALECMGEELGDFKFVSNLVYKCTETGLLLRGGAAQITSNALISNPVSILVDGDAARAGFTGADFKKYAAAGTCHHFGMPQIAECFIALGRAIRVRGKGKARVDKTVVNKCSMGIDVTDVCTPIFKDCVVSGCLVGASFAQHGGCEMSTCVLTRNVRNLIVTTKAVPLLSRCLFSNADYFNVIFDDDAGGTMLWCVVKQAVRGGGIYVGSGSTPTIQRCLIRAHTLTGMVEKVANSSALNQHGGVTEKRAVRKSFVGRASIVGRATARRHETFSQLRDKLGKGMQEENELLAKSMITGASQALMSASTRRPVSVSFKPGASASGGTSTDAAAASASALSASVRGQRGKQRLITFGASRSDRSPGDSDRSSITATCENSNVNQERSGLDAASRDSSFENTHAIAAAAATAAVAAAAAAAAATNGNILNSLGAGKSSNANTNMASSAIDADVESDDDDELQRDETGFDAVPPVSDCLSGLSNESSAGDPVFAASTNGEKSAASLKAEALAAAERSRKNRENMFLFGTSQSGGGGFFSSGIDPGRAGAVSPQHSFANVFGGQKEAARRRGSAATHQADRGGFRGSGLAVDSGGRPHVVKCVFRENNVGLIVRKEGDPQVENCTFEENLDHGILLLPNSRGLFKNCRVMNNHQYQCLSSGARIATVFSFCTFGSPATEGMRCELGATPKVEDCKFVGCTDAGLMATSGAAPLMERCSFDDCCIGIIAVAAAGTYKNCTFAALSHCGALVEDEALMEPPLFEGNDFVRCTIVGLRVTSGGDAIVIGNRFHGNGIGVEISDASHAEMQENKIYDNQHEGVVVSDESTAHISRNIFHGNRGSELMVKLDSAPTVTENVFADSEGDGMTFVMSLGMVKCNKFLRCNGNAIVIRGASTLSSNYHSSGDTPPGSAHAHPQTLHVIGNFISENLGVGIVVSEAADSVDIIGNTIVGNGQGGVSVDTEASPRIVNNLVKLNRYRGVRCGNMARPEIRGNMISCTSPGSCVVVETSAVPTISNNIILSAADGGLRFTQKARGTAAGNLIAGCTGAGILVEGRATPTLQHNMIFDCDIGVHWRDGGGGFLTDAYITGVFNVAGFYLERGCQPKVEDCAIHDLHRVPAIIDFSNATLDRIFVLGCAAGVEIRGGKSAYNNLHVADCVFGMQIHGGMPTVTGAVLCHNQRNGVLVEKREEVAAIPTPPLLKEAQQQLPQSASVTPTQQQSLKPPPASPMQQQPLKSPASPSVANPAASVRGKGRLGKSTNNNNNNNTNLSESTINNPSKPAGKRLAGRVVSSLTAADAARSDAVPQGKALRGKPFMLAGEDSYLDDAKRPTSSEMRGEYGGTFSKCRIFHSKQGVVVEGGIPTFDECDVYWHSDGIVLAGGSPTVMRCNVYDNHNIGLWLKDSDAGSVRQNYGFDNGFATLLVDGGGFVVEENKLCFPKDGGAVVMRGGGQGTGMMGVTQLAAANVAALAKVQVRNNSERNKYDNPAFERSLADRKLSYQQYRHDVERHSITFRRSLRSFDGGCMSAFAAMLGQFAWWQFVAPIRLLSTPAGQRADVIRLSKSEREAAAAAAERKKKDASAAAAAGTSDPASAAAKKEGAGGGGGGDPPLLSPSGRVTRSESFMTAREPSSMRKRSPSSAAPASPLSASPLSPTFHSSPYGSSRGLDMTTPAGRDLTLMSEEEQLQRLWTDPEMKFIAVPARGQPMPWVVPGVIQARADAANNALGAAGRAAQQQQQQQQPAQSQLGSSSPAASVRINPATSVIVSQPQQPSYNSTSNISIAEAITTSNEVAGWFISDVVHRVEDLVRNAQSTAKAQASAAHELLGSAAQGAAGSMSPVATALTANSAAAAWSQALVAGAKELHTDGDDDDDDEDARDSGGLAPDMALDPESPTVSASRRNVALSWGGNTHAMQRTKTSLAQVKTHFVSTLENSVAQVNLLAAEALKEQLPAGYVPPPGELDRSVPAVARTTSFSGALESGSFLSGSLIPSPSPKSPSRMPVPVPEEGVVVLAVPQEAAAASTSTKPAATPKRPAGKPAARLARSVKK